MRIVQVDAFSDRAFLGNPAGVVLLDREIDDEVMLNISKEMNLSETAFVKKLDEDKCKFEFRYFTVTDEVDMCGHATISCLSVVNKYYDLENQFYIKTKAGEILVSIDEVDDRTTYYIRQPKGKEKKENVSHETLEKVLNIPFDKMKTSFPVEPIIYSTGLYDLLVPVNSVETLNQIVVNTEEMIKDSKEKDMVGYHCYALDGQTIHVRNFAPLYGIDEEAATGTSNGALLTLLYSKQLIEKGHYTIIQGEKMGKPTTIYGRIDEDGIWIGGACYTLFEGDLYI